MLLLRKPHDNQLKKRRFRLVNVALGLTAAAIFANLSAAHIQEPYNVRGWLYFPLEDFMITSIGTSLVIAAFFAWIIAGAWAV